jgi:hypothetical protein
VSRACRGYLTTSAPAGHTKQIIFSVKASAPHPSVKLIALPSARVGASVVHLRSQRQLGRSRRNSRVAHPSVQLAHQNRDHGDQQ